MLLTAFLYLSTAHSHAKIVYAQTIVACSQNN